MLVTHAGDQAGSYLLTTSRSASVWSRRLPTTLINTSIEIVKDLILLRLCLLTRLQLVLVRSAACRGYGVGMASSTMKELKRIVTAALVAYNSTEPFVITIRALAIPILKRQQHKNS
ncbi:uncharacterized protein M421DRAFT_398507 [Didymella exigua CBS 183.55]|uniref:Uncharacterized protein n=1 Tax=Didymella exigua CBS 183.55 TaxID=1150837 RepID=A0A6A5RER7_9PLEO|nr:uncharacterized protein M421DRAFT_398507 [Didymella exigua CBS 183.55]KAF1925594.1 hypothetical protein M421DRAFT_398507 [Didymella exigua CBS 183.55]